jgi:hypothetical protein
MVSLGLNAEKIAGVSLICDTGVFEFHYAAANTLLVALDNRIWTLDRTPGARASKSSPEGVVQRFLEAHFASDMGFTPESVKAKRTFLTDELATRISAYLAKPVDPNEAPSINGDPFTDSQEYPTRFAVDRDNKKVKGAAVPVTFSDAFHKRGVSFEMARENGRWLINDLDYEDGSSFSALLAD